MEYHNTSQTTATLCQVFVPDLLHALRNALVVFPSMPIFVYSKCLHKG
jgi:hypothetical protein